MNKKNLCVIMVSILLIIVGILITIKFNNDSKITLFGKTLNSLDEIEESDIQEYLITARMLFSGKTYHQFSDEDITIYVAYGLLNNQNVSNIEVQQFVVNTFDKKNFELKEGKYYSSLDDEIIIIKNGDDFTTSIPGKGIHGLANYYNSMEVKGNQIIVHYDYNKLNYLGPLIEDQNQYELVGTNDIYLRYKNNHLVIEKIIYTEK